MKHRIPTQRRPTQDLSSVTLPAWRTATQSKAVRQYPWGIPLTLGAVYALLFLLVAL